MQYLLLQGGNIIQAAMGIFYKFTRLVAFFFNAYPLTAVFLWVLSKMKQGKLMAILVAQAWPNNFGIQSYDGTFLSLNGCIYMCD